MSTQQNDRCRRTGKFQALHSIASPLALSSEQLASLRHLPLAKRHRSTNRFPQLQGILVRCCAASSSRANEPKSRWLLASRQSPVPRHLYLVSDYPVLPNEPRLRAVSAARICMRPQAQRSIPRSTALISRRGSADEVAPLSVLHSTRHACQSHPQPSDAWRAAFVVASVTHFASSLTGEISHTFLPPNKSADTKRRRFAGPPPWRTKSRPHLGQAVASAAHGRLPVLCPSLVLPSAGRDEFLGPSDGALSHEHAGFVALGGYRPGTHSRPGRARGDVAPIECALRALRGGSSCPRPRLGASCLDNRSRLLPLRVRSSSAVRWRAPDGFSTRAASSHSSCQLAGAAYGHVDARVGHMRSRRPPP
ncbi:hypothetical protein FKP32DRAFT_668267 [Trametes sanguinea]|nr:hypothetical protein FKP32DRAFT_668267 [Trametes sanguinea]